MSNDDLTHSNDSSWGVATENASDGWGECDNNSSSSSSEVHESWGGITDSSGAGVVDGGLEGGLHGRYDRLILMCWKKYERQQLAQESYLDTMCYKPLHKRRQNINCDFSDDVELWVIFSEWSHDQHPRTVPPVHPKRPPFPMEFRTLRPFSGVQHEPGFPNGHDHRSDLDIRSIIQGMLLRTPSWVMGARGAIVLKHLHRGEYFISKGIHQMQMMSGTHFTLGDCYERYVHVDQCGAISGMVTFDQHGTFGFKQIVRYNSNLW